LHANPLAEEIDSLPIRSNYCESRVSGLTADPMPMPLAIAGGGAVVRPSAATGISAYCQCIYAETATHN
jgi:hypothetical protein